MPELPEVQTIVNDLQKILPGLKISGVSTDAKNLFRKESFDDFRKEVVGKKITNVERKGKNILINLSGNKTILIHQKMTGHLLYGKWTPSLASDGVKIKSWTANEDGPIKDDPMNRFIHVVFDLSDNPPRLPPRLGEAGGEAGKQLALSDMRKFAKVLVLHTDKLGETADLNLGVDPFDKNFTLEKFKEVMRSKKSGKIKTVLMDQSLIAGIGNIYSDEILWMAGVHPLKKIQDLNEKELVMIYKAILPILDKALLARGTSSSDYRDVAGEKGSYQKMTVAYRLTGNPCQKNDGGTITRIKVGGRSAHFCPAHQEM